MEINKGVASHLPQRKPGQILRSPRLAVLRIILQKRKHKRLHTITGGTQRYAQSGSSLALACTCINLQHTLHLSFQ